MIFTKEAQGLTALHEVGAHSLMTSENFPHMPEDTLRQTRLSSQMDLLGTLANSGLTDEITSEKFPNISATKLHEARLAAQSNSIPTRLQLLSETIELLSGVAESPTGMYL